MEKGKLKWITGLSGAGKTTIGTKVYSILKKKYQNCVFVDGDIFREILGNEFSHSKKDRLKNAKIISRLCTNLTNQNIHVVCCTMSLFNEIHQMNRINTKNYIEIFIHVEIEKLIERDSKGIYSSLKNGEIKNVVGVDLMYDKPSNPSLIIDNSDLKTSIDEKVNLILKTANFL